MKIPGAIADSLTVRCVFYNKIRFVPKEYGWVTHPYPVLVMMTAGKGRITIAHSKRTIVAADLMAPCFLPAYTMRRPAVTGDAPLDMLALGFSFDVLGGIGLLDLYDVPIVFPGKNGERLKSLMLELFDLGAAQDASTLGRLAERKRVLFEILGVLARDAAPKGKGVLLNTEEYGCLPAVEYLKGHFADPFDMEKLRMMCHCSQSHFFRLFKRLTGVSPFTYLKDRRIEEAQKLLITTGHGVAEIGERVGWSDQFHFCRIFKARTGYSPSQFRQQYAVR